MAATGEGLNQPDGHDQESEEQYVQGGQFAEKKALSNDAQGLSISDNVSGTVTEG